MSAPPPNLASAAYVASWLDRHRAAAVAFAVLGALIALVPTAALLIEPHLTYPHSFDA